MGATQAPSFQEESHHARCFRGPNPSKTLTQSVTQACPTANLTCSASGTFVNCTGSGGTGGYTYFWKQDDTYPDGSTYNGSWVQGSTTKGYYFVTATTRDELMRVNLSFKVRDSSGMESPARLNTRLCKY